MIDQLYAFLYGVVQAITEFLPISSSGHLLLLHEVLPVSFSNELAFDVALHVGTLCALVAVFYRDIAKYSIALVRSFSKWELKTDPDQRVAWWIVVGTIPAAVIGAFAGDSIETFFRSPFLVAWLLIGVGALFFPIEKLSAKTKSLEGMSRFDAVLIGCAQVLAFIPGVSRSGITMLTAFGRGMTREAAARFSFLLSIPIVFLAGAKNGYDVVQSGITGTEALTMAIGLIGAAVAGIVVIKYFLKFVRNHTLIPFAWYRIALGVVTFIVLIFFR